MMRDARYTFATILLLLFTGASLSFANTVGFVTTPESADEGDGDVPLGVYLKDYTSGTVQVQYNLVPASMTATEGVDFDLPDDSHQFSFSANDTQYFDISLLEDGTDEYWETIVFTLSVIAGVSNVENSPRTFTITDNDSASVLQFAASSSNNNEGTTAAKIALSIAPVSGKYIDVDYAVLGGIATSIFDYNLPADTETIPPGQGTWYIDFTVVNDDLDEANEDIDVRITNPVNATMGATIDHKYWIVDNDAEPTLQFASQTSSNPEDQSPTIQVNLSPVSGRDVFVSYTVSGQGTAEPGGTDHDLASGSFTIVEGQTSHDITFNVTDDNLDEYDETVIITLADPSTAVLGSYKTHTYTIEDNDPEPEIQFSTDVSNGFENISPVTFELTIGATPSGRDVQVDYAVTAGTALGLGTDYTLLGSGTATISEGSTTTDYISATINNDDLLEATETFTISLSNPVNADLGTNWQHTYQIQNNDPEPLVAFSLDSSQVVEGFAAASLVVSQDRASGLATTVNYAVSGGTATVADYSLAASYVTIPAGSQSANISVNITDDGLDEPRETVVVSLSGPNNADLGAKTSHTVTILDNDSEPDIYFSLATSSGNEAGDPPSFALELSEPSGFDVTVAYTATGLTATEGLDFTMADGTATILAGLTTTSISTAVIHDDALDEVDETFRVSLSSPNKAVIVTPSFHTYTITNDDVTPIIGFSTTSLSQNENVTPVLPTITISAESGKNISIDYSISGTAVGSGTDYSLAAGPVTISAGQTISQLTLDVINDLIYENNETVILTLTDPVNTTIDTSRRKYTYTIQNNDAAPEIEFATTTSHGSEGSTPAIIQINLNPAPAAVSAVDATVNYAVTGGTATGGGVDYTLLSGTATVAAGQTSTTISIDIEDDQLYESLTSETIILTLSGENHATLGTNTTHTYSIDENDDPPNVAFVSQGSSGSESVASVNIPVALTAASQLTVTVDYAVTAGDPPATGGGNDYSLLDGQLTFLPGSRRDTITAAIVNNALVEEDEKFKITLSSPVNAELGSPATHTFTILDDDDPPVDFTVDSVYATGGVKVLGYWNASNTGLRVLVPVDTSSKLISGSIQLQARIGGGAYQNFGAEYTIVGGDLGQNKAHSRTAAQVEALTNFANDSTLTVRAIMDDAVGNSTTGSPSSSIIIIDQAPPAAFTTGSVITTGGTAVAGYWNASNTGLRITVPLILTDNSLSGGTIQLRGEADGAFENLGTSVSITQTDVNAQSKNLTVSATEATVTGVEELAGYTEGDILTFRSVITDIAGNSTTGAVSANTLIVDETVPTASIAYSDTLVSQGDTVTFTMTMDEAATATPRISIAYSLNTVSATNMTATADPAVWTYDAIIPAANDGSATLTLTAKDLAGNALTTGNTSNRTKLVVDNTPPGYVLSYTDSLVKLGDTFTITATIAEPVQPTPTLSINYTGTTDDVTDATMSMGASDSVWTYLTTAPSGNDGFATVTMSGLDIAGNTVTPISGSTNTLKVDNIPPTLVITAPVDGDFVRTTTVSYNLGEALPSGQMVWTWEENEGVTDVNTPHTQALAGSELRAGSFSGLLTNAPTLVQAAEYSVELIGFDRAGNSDTVEVTTVTYDTLPPAITAVTIQDGPGTDIDSTRSTDTLTVHYSGFSEPTSGIALYEYALGSSAGADDLVDWTSAGTDTLVTVRGLQLDYKDYYYFKVRATDGADNLSDSVVSDGIRIVDKPRLTIHAVQNIVFSDYLQVLVNDTLGMADSIRVLIDSVRVSVNAIDTYSYVGTHKFTQTGTHSLQVTGYSGWGDTLRTASLSMALAKSWQTWNATSADGGLRVSGIPGAVNEDRRLMIVGSELLGLSSGEEPRYRLADGQMPFAKPVKISMREMEKSGISKSDQAVYLLLLDGQWQELPSVDEQGSVSAWADRSGTFKLGPRTIIVPSLTALHQNYPNPFNPVTTIVFDLGLQDGPSQNATITVYNLLGQQVKTLFDGPAMAGRYTLSWPGVNDLGAQVATGIYFVRLLTDHGIQKTRKMLLIR